MVRPKTVHAMETEWINHHWFILRLVTSAGAYIKEFVHGDLGRTVPNVGSLLGAEGHVDILQLDVLNVLEAGAPVTSAESAELGVRDVCEGWESTPCGVWVKHCS
jgi:tRNA pseudouridine synthase 10